MSLPIVDIHMHSTLKPYGLSKYDNSNPLKVNDASCIWYRDSQTTSDEFWEDTVGISRYRQSDFTTLCKGQVRVALVALYPIEKGFFNPKIKVGEKVARWLGNFVSLIGKKRIAFVQSDKYNYFQDLQDEYVFISNANLVNSHSIGSALTYTLLSKGDDVEKTDYNLEVILTIEGAHVFCEGTEVTDRDNWKNIKANIAKVKAWPTPPFFITLAHHFYNGLCTHAKSLYGLNQEILDQTFGMRDIGHQHNDNMLPLNDIGRTVISELLSKDNGRRILIDVKHMSIEARTEYYKILTTDFKDENIPVICSHGSLFDFYNHEINMNHDDLMMIFKTDGLFGVEIDQRVLGYEEQKNKFFKYIGNIFRKDSRQNMIWAKYYWNTVIKIAEVAYKNGFSDDPWKYICVGSDYDGIINPLNEYRTAETLPTLHGCLLEYLNNYWKNKNSIIPKDHNSMDAQTVVYNIMYKNAKEFIVKHYK